MTLITATDADFERAGALPYDEAVAYFATIGNFGELAKARWGQNYEQHGVMHVTDHQSAWEVVFPGVVATYFDIEDSLNSGSDALLTTAARITFNRNGPSQTTPDNARMELLVQMHGISAGLNIFMGRRPDPNKGKPLEAYKDADGWHVRLVPGGVTPQPPVPPVAPPNPPPAPPVPPTPARPKIPADVAVAMTKIVKFNQGYRRKDAMDNIIMPWILTIADPE